ncbi:MAG: LamG domain-containing protein, partial [Patescibacteria group bacterium]
VSYDASGNFHTGALTNGASWTSSGATGGALSLDGVNDYVSITRSDKITYNSGMTIGAWVKTTAAVTNGYHLISKVGTDFNWRLGFSGSQLATISYVNTGGSNYLGVAGHTAVNDGKWHYLAGTINFINPEIKIYFDGILEKSSNTTSGTPSLSSAQNPVIGQNPSLTGTYWKGLVDEVKIYDYALSSRQIALDYNGGGPAEYWSFNEGNASTTANLGYYSSSTVSNNGNLTLADNTLWAPGKLGLALSFDGTNDQLNGVTNGVMSYNSSSSHTYMAWIKHTLPTTDSAYHWIIHGYGGSNGTTFALVSRKPAFWYQGGTTYVQGNTVLDNNWHHVAATYDADKYLINLYVDGALDKSA